MRQQPTSVTLLGKQQLETAHATSLKEASALVPNLFIPNYGSRLTSAIYIRGIGSRLNTPAVGLYVDNIPYVDKSAFDFNFYDIERVDVLRGPQGTLYGRNTMGGLVRIFTKNPLHYQGTTARLSYATGDNHRTASLTHYHRVSDQLAFSAGGYYEGGDGFFKNSTTNQKVDKMQSGGGRLRGIYRPNERLSFDLNVGYDYSDEGAYPYFYTGGIEAKKTTDTSKEPYQSLIGKISNNRKSSYRRSLLNTGLNIEYRADRWQMNAVTGFQHLNDRMFLDQDFLAPDIYTLEQRQRINTLTEEITFKNTTGSKWQWLTGVNLMYQSLHTTGPVTFYRNGLDWLASNINSNMPTIDRIPMLQMMGFKGMGIQFHGDQLLMDGTYDTPTTGLALFHQSTYRFTNRFSASLGLRLDYERQKMQYDSPCDVAYSFTMPNEANEKMAVNLQDLSLATQYVGELRNNHLRLLPRFSLDYQVGDKKQDGGVSGNLYATTAMGQRSGGYNLQMFSDLLQSSMSVGMMEQIKTGVGDYLDYLVANNSNIPKAIPDPDNAGSMIGLPDFVRRVMEQNMPKFEEGSTEQVVYRPEYSLNFEVGTHLDVGNTFNCMGRRMNTLQLDAAVFYNRIYDQQIARFAPSGLGRMMVNAGKSQSCGAELSLLWHPISQLALSGSYGYTHATFLEYEDGKGNDYAGKHVPYVPSHTVNLDAAYTWQFDTDGGEHSWWNIQALTFGLNASGAGRIYWTESNDVSQDFYGLLNARIALTTPHFTLSLWGKNLTNNHYNTFYFESASRGFEQHGRPLQVGVDLSLNF